METVTAHKKISWSWICPDCEDENTEYDNDCDICYCPGCNNEFDIEFEE